MTCIAGFVDRTAGCVHMASDSLAASENYIGAKRQDPKLFRNGQYVIGFTSSYRMGQLLMFAKLPVCKHKLTLRFMVTEFVPFIRKLFKDGGYSTVTNNAEACGVFLVASGAKLFCIQSDYQVKQSSIDTCGSGEAVAMGALHVAMQIKAHHKWRLRMALQAAENILTNVRGPFHYLSTNGDK